MSYLLANIHLQNSENKEEEERKVSYMKSIMGDNTKTHKELYILQKFCSFLGLFN